MSDERNHKDKVWNVDDPMLRGSWESIQVSILQDIRDALKGLNQQVEVLLQLYDPKKAEEPATVIPIAKPRGRPRTRTNIAKKR